MSTQWDTQKAFVCDTFNGKRTSYFCRGLLTQILTHTNCWAVSTVMLDNHSTSTI